MVFPSSGVASLRRRQPPFEPWRGTAGKEARSILAPHGRRAALHFPEKTPLITFAHLTHSVTREPFRDHTNAPECCTGAMNDVDHVAPRSSTVKMNKERHHRSSQTTFLHKWATDSTNAAVKAQNKRTCTPSPTMTIRHATTWFQGGDAWRRVALPYLTPVVCA